MIVVILDILVWTKVVDWWTDSQTIIVVRRVSPLTWLNKKRLMRHRWRRLAPKQACVSRRTINVSLHAFTTLDISAVLTHYGWTFTPFKRNPSLPQRRKPNRSCTCEETLRLLHSDRRVGICQSVGLSPSSFRVIRGLRDLNTVSRMVLRTRMGQITGLSLHLRLLFQRGLMQDCLYTSES